MMISFTETRKTPASSSMSCERPFMNSAITKRTKVMTITSTEPRSRYRRILGMRPPMDSCSGSPGGSAGWSRRRLLELEGRRAQPAEQLAGGLEAAVVGGRHHRARERVAMPALERQFLQDAAPPGQAQGALGGHQAHVRAVGLGLIHRQHGG